MKTRILKNLIQRSILICFDEKLLEDELNYLRNIFIIANEHTPKLANNIIKKELEKNNSDR